MKKHIFYLMSPVINLGMLACNTGSEEQAADTISGIAVFDMQKREHLLIVSMVKLKKNFKRSFNSAGFSLSY